MAGENTAGIAIPEAAAIAEDAKGAAQGAAQAAEAGLAYIAQHRIMLDGKEFLPGEVLQLADGAIVAALRSTGAIKLESELQDAAAMAEQAARHALENAQLRTLTESMAARIQELEAQAAAGAKAIAGGAGKAASK